MLETFDSELKAKRLRNMKRMATGLLLLMAVIYVVSPSLSRSFALDKLRTSIC